MTKYITVKLTVDQAYSVIQALEWAKPEPIERWSDSKQDFVNYYDSDQKSSIAFYNRIISKIIKEQSKNKLNLR